MSIQPVEVGQRVTNSQATFSTLSAPAGEEWAGTFKGNLSDNSKI